MQVLGVVLDLDGTLVDHDGAVTRALCQWLPALAVTPTPAVLARWTAVQRPHLAAWRAGQITFAEQRRHRLRDFLPAVGAPLPADDAALDALFAGYLHWYHRFLRMFPDVPAALAAIRRAGVASAVLTNGTYQQQTGKLARVGLGALAPVLTVDTVGAAKPDPRTYLAACDRLGLPPQLVLHVGDNHDLDVLGPRAAGLPAVHLDRAGRGPADAAWRITDLEQLARYLPTP